MHKLNYILILVLTCFLIDSSKYSAIDLSNSSQNNQNSSQLLQFGVIDVIQQLLDVLTILIGVVLDISANHVQRMMMFVLKSLRRKEVSDLKFLRSKTEQILILASEFITRDCLSALVPYRTDIPADKYEGCRPATYDPKLANYVNNSIKEINVKRDYFDSTLFCFCFLDHRCNGSNNLSISTTLLVVSLTAVIAFLRH